MFTLPISSLKNWERIPSVDDCSYPDTWWVDWRTPPYQMKAFSSPKDWERIPSVDDCSYPDTQPSPHFHFVKVDYYVLPSVPEAFYERLQDTLRPICKTALDQVGAFSQPLKHCLTFILRVQQHYKDYGFTDESHLKRTLSAYRSALKKSSPQEALVQLQPPEPFARSLQAALENDSHSAPGGPAQSRHLTELLGPPQRCQILLDTVQDHWAAYGFKNKSHLNKVLHRSIGCLAMKRVTYSLRFLNEVNYLESPLDTTRTIRLIMTYILFPYNTTIKALESKDIGSLKEDDTVQEWCSTILKSAEEGHLILPITRERELSEDGKEPLLEAIVAVSSPIFEQIALGFSKPFQDALALYRQKYAEDAMALQKLQSVVNLDFCGEDDQRYISRYKLERPKATVSALYPLDPPSLDSKVNCHLRTYPTIG